MILKVKVTEKPANNLMVYSGRFVSKYETNIEEELDNSFRLMLNKWKEGCLTIDNHNKTIGILQKESQGLALTITCGEEKISSLNSKLGNLILLERKLKNSSLPNEKLECGEMTKDVKRTNDGTGLKDVNTKVPPKEGYHFWNEDWSFEVRPPVPTLCSTCVTSS